MTLPDDDRLGDDGVYQSATARRPGRRRKQVAMGMAGLAVVLGAGAYLATGKLADQRTDAADAGALLPRTPATSTASGRTLSPGPFAVTPSGSPNRPQGSASVPAVPKEVMKSIEAVRREAAKDSVKVTRPLKQATAKVTDVKQTTTGSLSKGILRVVSARGDLTGQRELAWVAGGITGYRGAKCSQTFRFSTNPKPAKKDSLLLCWRTSAEKSVVAVVVDARGNPSKAKAVTALDKQWRAMG